MCFALGAKVCANISSAIPKSRMNTLPPRYTSTLMSVSVGTGEGSENTIRSYALMTAAYNEAAHIEKTIQSVLAQTVRPQRWVIVSDGSTDETDQIVGRYAQQNDFIRFMRMARPPGHSFRTKVVALQAGQKHLFEVPFAFIGNLDADITIGTTYFAELMERFCQNPKLGLAGGFVCEEAQGEYKRRASNRTHSVAHAAQLARRECYEAIGGYQVLEYGGEDWHAQVSANMNGWETEAFPDLPIYHLRHTGAGTNLLRSSFRLGKLDYSFGSDPLFEAIKCVLRIPSKPLVLGGVLRFLGFAWLSLRREKRPVSLEFTSFLRSQQKARVANMFGREKDSAAGFVARDTKS
jgi:biofilm PGA synthesis N-glycosyltransferase PgaC